MSAQGRADSIRCLIRDRSRGSASQARVLSEGGYATVLRAGKSDSSKEPARSGRINRAGFERGVDRVLCIVDQDDLRPVQSLSFLSAMRV